MKVFDVVVLEISVHVEPPFVEVCHFIILPVLPLNVTVPLFVALQNVLVVVEVVPPTEAALTVMIVALEFASVQLTPLLTTALYC